MYLGDWSDPVIVSVNFKGFLAPPRIELISSVLAPLFTSFHQFPDDD